MAEGSYYSSEFSVIVIAEFLDSYDCVRKHQRWGIDRTWGAL